MGRRPDGSTPAPEARAFAVPRRLAGRRIVEVTAGKLAVSMHGGQPARVRYLDTFDRRLRRAGLVLEHTALPGAETLRCRGFGCATVLVEAPGVSVPEFSCDVAHTRLRALLSPLIDVRRLLVIAETRGRLTAARCRDREGKVVLDLESFTTRSGPARLTVRPLRGYERFAGRAIHRIRNVEGVVPDRDEPMLAAPDGPGAAFGGMAAPGRVALDPEERSDTACRRLLAALNALMELNAPAVEADVDPECLHDFRVAIRKARSLLGEMKHVFPPGVTRRLRSDLGWLGKLTGPVRDLDVHLLALGASTREGGAAGDAFAALLVYLREAREREFLALSRSLRSARYRRARAAFRRFVARPSPARPGSEHALTPIAALSATHVLRVYRRTLAEGRAIGDDSPAESLHELRKSCKRLRYLLEFFHGVHRAKPVDRAIDRLKQLQDNLGAYQDLQVQRAVLEEFREHGRAVLDVDGLGAALAARERETRAEFAARFERYDSERAHAKLAAALGHDPA